MHHVQYAKREVAQAGAQQKCAARAVKKASTHATQRRLHADQQRTYLEHGGCTCGSLVLYEPYDYESGLVRVRGDPDFATHKGHEAFDPGVHGDELRRGGHEEPFALYYKHKRMCNCDCKAQRRLQGTGLWEAGHHANPMNVECQRKLTRRAVEQSSAANKKLKPLRERLSAAKRERDAAEERLAAAREAAAGLAAEALEDCDDLLEKDEALRAMVEEAETFGARWGAVGAAAVPAATTGAGAATVSAAASGVPPKPCTEPWGKQLALDELDDDSDTSSDEEASQVAVVQGDFPGLAALHLTARDFPLRLVFLDKSGSMGCDKTSFGALCMSAQMALSPSEGSCLLVLLAGPGETQLFFTRAGGAAREPVDVKLGCSTWFNEPVWLILRALVPLVEALKHALPSSQPPLSVVCITDGMDNQSCSLLGTLPQLADAVGQIKGLATPCEPVYAPLGNWKPRDVMAALGIGRVPVLLVWVALGAGANSMLEQAVPGRLVVVDAGYEGDLLAARRRSQPARGGAAGGAQGSIAVGTCVLAAPPGLAHPETAPRTACALVTAVHAHGLTLMYTTDGTEQSGVRLADVDVQEPPLRAGAAMPSPERRPEYALALIHAAMTQPAQLASRHVDAKTGVVDLSVGVALVSSEEELLATVQASTGQLRVTPPAYEPIAPGFMKALLRALGSACSTSGMPLSDAEAEAALRMLLAALTELLQDRRVRPDAGLAGVAKAGLGGLGNGHDGVARLRRVVEPTHALLECLTAGGVLDRAEARSRTGVASVSYKLRELARPALTAAKTLLCSLPEPLAVCRRSCASGGHAPRAAQPAPTARRRRSVAAATPCHYRLDCPPEPLAHVEVGEAVDCRQGHGYGAMAMPPRTRLHADAARVLRSSQLPPTRGFLPPARTQARVVYV